MYVAVVPSVNEATSIVEILPSSFKFLVADSALIFNMFLSFPILSCTETIAFLRLKSKSFGSSDIENGLQIIKGADAVISNGELQQNILVRNLSASVYGGSKTFEHYESRICTAIRRILMSDEEKDWDLLLDEAEQSGKKVYELFGVSKNPFSETMKGNAEITTPNGTIHTCGCSYAFFSDEEASYLHIRIRDS